MTLSGVELNKVLLSESKQEQLEANRKSDYKECHVIDNKSNKKPGDPKHDTQNNTPPSKDIVEKMPQRPVRNKSSKNKGQQGKLSLIIKEIPACEKAGERNSDQTQEKISETTVARKPELPIRAKDKRSKLVPQMPVIEEDILIRTEEIRKGATIIMGTNSLERNTLHRTWSSNSNSSSSSEGGLTPEKYMQNATLYQNNPRSSPVSLLDSLHKKFYPEQYHRKIKSVSADCIQKSPVPKMGTAIVHSKSVQFDMKGVMRSRVDRFSDSNVQYGYNGPKSPRIVPRYLVSLIKCDMTFHLFS